MSSSGINKELGAVAQARKPSASEAEAGKCYKIKASLICRQKKRMIKT